MYVLTRVNADPTGGNTFNLNAKFHFRLFVHHSLQEFVRVLNRVWMRKKIAQRDPDFAIVRVPCQRVSVVQSPWANRASL